MNVEIINRRFSAFSVLLRLRTYYYQGIYAVFGTLMVIGFGVFVPKPEFGKLHAYQLNMFMNIKMLSQTLSCAVRLVTKAIDDYQ